MGNALKEQDKLEEAIQAYTKALSIKPDYADAYLHAIEVLKVHPDVSVLEHEFTRIDGKIKEIGKKLLSNSSNGEIALCVSEALDCLQTSAFKFKTPLSQIYKRNSIDLNCGRHTKIFNENDIIPEFCFGCFKVQVEVNDLLSLIRLTKLFYDLTFVKDLTRKTMIELRPDISGFYKGLFYCRGLEQARHLKKTLDIELNRAFDSQIASQIKRGCSEFPFKFPQYGKIENDETVVMDYPFEWKAVEDQFDQDHPRKPKENLIPSLSEFCLSDFYIMQKWIDYAKGLEDPSCEAFQEQPIVFKDIYDIAVERKVKFGQVF